MMKIISGQTCLRQILKANHCSMERQIVRGVEMTSFGHAGSRVNLMYKSVALETDNQLQEIIRFLTLHLVEKGDSEGGARGNQDRKKGSQATTK